MCIYTYNIYLYTNYKIYGSVCVMRVIRDDYYTCLTCIYNNIVL